MKKSVILLCGLALIAMIIGYSYKEPVEEKEAENDQVIENMNQTPAMITIEEKVVTAEVAETEKDDEIPTPTPMPSAENEADSNVIDQSAVLDSETESYYEKGRELGQEVKDYLQDIDWDEKYDKAREAGKEAADFLNGLLR
ncbi:MAG: hypothetical protein IJM34_10665 [Lachnospiraceae bacterium]|nr:hypothetical protein [Lachnospiraceae bacterium]